MATLTKDKARTYEQRDPVYNHAPIIADDIIYRGAGVGEDGTTGYVRPLVAGDTFMGFAVDQCDNSGGSAGDKNVKLRTRGAIEVSVTGVTGVADLNDDVFLADDDTFTLTPTSNTHIGWISRHVSGTTCLVEFEAESAKGI